METIAIWTFWAAAGGILYTYAGYPALVGVLARLFRRAPAKAPGDFRYSVVLAAHNEAARLPAKLRSLLAARPAGQLLEILIGSDGSTDDPVAAAASVGDPRVQVIAFPERRGKPAVLNDLMGRVRGDVVVMMDARQEVDPEVFAQLLPNFSDPKVGVVSGELVFRRSARDTATAEGMDAYWRYEKFIRRNEGCFRSVPGATGAIYAIRRTLLRPLPPQTILDDVAIPMLAVRQGYRCVFESGAVVYDEPSSHPEQESARKRRTLAGNAQLVGLFPWLVVPGLNPIWFEFVSHKLMRLLAPYLMLLTLAANLVLSGISLYRVFLLLQVLFYGLALGGWLLARRGRKGGLVSVPFLFVSLNVAAMQGLWDALTGRARVQWSRTAAAG